MSRGDHPGALLDICPLQKIPLHTIMLFVCHPDILHKHCLQFLLGVKIAPRESENNVYAKFGVTNEEHYGILWYFLEWSIGEGVH